ncbi:hypothetical protein B7R22_14885 [Subtercola boreus]|uniref:HTH cro/C1-type domain-containing protein n=1 Tax=Subtercola boreus TaxID=120213 RepID=A0A3E0VSY2_9MICO|nr:XRE family transcriptional regulator [Subtercola boreus]RFA12831.1 hypothetical protein B7R22_14885 [Subtercola boreus]
MQDAADRPPEGTAVEDGRNVGPRLREIRLESGQSLRAVAQKLGISPSALSQIETGAKLPSVNRLLAIVTALDVPLSTVFESAPTATGGVAHSVSRSGDVPLLNLGDGVTYRRLSPTPVPGLEMFESTYPPGSTGSAHSSSRLIKHGGYEVGNVSRGELTIDFENETVTLGPGDSISFHATRPHMLSNRGTEACIAIWVIAH